MNAPDRAALAARNKTLAARTHAPKLRERIRRVMLGMVARIPPRGQPPDKGTMLLIRPDHLGDVLLTLPAVQALGKALGGRGRLIALTGPWGAEPLAACPDIETVLTLPFPGFTRGGERRGLLAPYLYAYQQAAHIRALRAETAIILRPDHWWGGLLAYWAGIPERVGYAQPDLRPFLTHALPYEKAHAAWMNLRLIERWAGQTQAVQVHFPVHQADREYVRALLAAQGIGGRPYLVIHPGAGSAIKQWPAEKWAAVADRLSERLQCETVFTGSDREHKLILPVMRHMTRKAVSLAGETNIAQLAALYADSRLVLGPDTGPLHLAAASGVPTIHLYGPADAGLFGPWGDPERHIVIAAEIGCAPCGVLDWRGDDPALHPCIREIDAARVVNAALRAVGLRA